MSPFRLLLTAVLMALGPAQATACPESLDFTLRPLASSAEPVRLCDRYAGKVLLMVNTASKCAYTPQYEGLEALSRQYADRDLVVLGFPSNDFAGQEPGTEQQIQAFCKLTYAVAFPMFEKLRVRGPDAHPLYRLLAEQGGGEPGWNFHKYLIARDGRVVAAFPSSTAPDDARLLEAIELQLAQPRYLQ